ncbi:LamG domain-containing protein [Lentzea sp. HUAS12]|uniref:LamG domain-containing protein n=1 Tax=Lentzea sp. HUAS12 TaxID=2951806 RepID=UPI00209DDD56|nr:LamG domain-containing protein [Lentzea sp. HUAS12]USX49358.1 LamG domain-containing protein [Lentzea sp. HUAS12]
MINANGRRFALPAFTAALVLLGSATASAHARPNPPTDLSIESRSCEAGVLVPTRTPTLRAKLSDGQGSSADFIVYQGADRVVELTASGASSGSFAEVVVPQGVLAEGGIYRWSVRASDGKRKSKWADCGFQVDSTAPEQPVVTSVDYPKGGFNGSPGRTGVFTFAPGTSTDVVGYGWSLNVDTFANRVSANGPVDVPITPTVSGPNSLYVRAYDRAGNPSARQVYEFMVASPSKPVAAWNLDETSGTTAADSTGHGHALTLHGASFGPGYSGNGLIGSSSSTGTGVVDSSRAFSVSAWVKLGETGSSHAVAGQQSGFSLGYTGGHWSFGTASSATTPSAGEWTHLAGVYEPGKVSLYVNGKLEGTGNATFAGASGPFVLGQGQATAAVDHVQVWDRVLSAVEVVKHNNLVAERAHYLLDEREGTTAKDEVTGQNATLSGGVTWAGTPLDPDDPNQIPTSKDKWAGFDSTGLITGPRPANLRTDRSFVISAWVRPQGDLAATVLGLGDAPFGLAYRPDSNRWSFQWGEEVLLADIPVLTNDWVHLAATFDATTGTVALHVNGTRQSGTRTVLQPADLTGDLVVGRGFTGAVDDPRVFSGWMDEQDVNDLRTASTHR